VLQPEVVDVNGIVTGMEDMLRRLISEDIEIVTALAADLGHVRADPRQLEQVILNLAVNARDAMPGGGRLAIATQNVVVDEAHARREPDAPLGTFVVMIVADTGIGMDQATLARIFEPFFTTKEEGKGTGLGLATVYGIVQQSGGHVTVETAPGRGTTFKVYLPRVEEAAPAPAAAAAPLEAAASTGTVLLVEDEPSLRLVIEEMLSEAGYTVLSADSTQAAVEAARSHGGSIDLLLTDMVMPGTGGRDLAAQVQALRPDIRVVYMSGYSEQMGELPARVHFIQKPFTDAALLQKLRAALAPATG
jgi:CheY-like chemotaxis protein